MTGSGGFDTIKQVVFISHGGENMESRLANEIQDMTHLFTKEISPAIRTSVLKAIADPGAEIGYGNWMNLCRPCLFTFSLFEATGHKELPKNFSEQLIANSLGIPAVAVVHGAKMWDEWNIRYPQACETFRDNIRDFLITQELAESYLESSLRDEETRRESDGILIDAASEVAR